MATKYLVINHPEDANIKTILAYDVPPVALGNGYLNFNDSDGNNNTVDINVTLSAQTVSVPFTYGGDSNAPAPVIGNFAVGTNNPAWVSNETVTLNSGNGTGTLQFDITNNQTGSSGGRTLHITYSGDTTHSNQTSGYYRVSVLQAGGTYVQK